ncbi:MAG: hypothetical protein JSU94_12045 [Phycisphaerales bacterium]|nr:MAG: hypothetical protein JSU94_12045 [Phycisphaerales bacterium]
MKKNLLTITASLAVCGIVLWLSGLIHGRERTYRVRPEITLPEYRTDAARAIDAYERMMSRYMILTDRNLSGVNTDVKAVLEKLDSIERKLSGLSGRMARIERALGIEEPRKGEERTARPQVRKRPVGEGAEPPAR